MRCVISHYTIGDCSACDKRNCRFLFDTDMCFGCAKSNLEEIECAHCSRAAGYMDMHQHTPKDVLCSECYEELAEEAEEQAKKEKKITFYFKFIQASACR